MQDYSFLQYTILDKLFPCGMTILGDKAQTIEEQEQDVTAFLPGIFGKQMRKIVMRKRLWRLRCPGWRNRKITRLRR